MSFDGAAALIGDGATITACASAGMMVPEAALAAVEKRFLATGHPRGLTAFFPIAIGDRISLPGLDHLAHDGLLKRVIGGSYVLGRSDGSGNKLARMVIQNKVEAYNLPLGTMMHMLRDTAARKPGTFTEVGLGTFVDPRQRGGKINEAASEDLVELVEFDGREYLRYKPVAIDVAIIRATTADENGNLSFEHEPGTLGILSQVMAAKSNGGTVIAQVKRLTQKHTRNPHAVKVPGMLVDAIVVDPDQMQGTQTLYDPSLSGEVRMPNSQVDPLPLTVEKIIARRAMLELRRNMLVNVGFGIPGNIPRILVEENRGDELSFLIEQGSWGGQPVNGLQFGASRNPQCIIDSGAQMDFIDSGSFDMTCLAFGEVDALGSVNVSKLGLLIPGCGGFINIVNNVPKVVFCATFTSGGLEVDLSSGRPQIRKEGRFRKFVREIEHVTYNASRMRAKGKEVIYVTERAVFRLAPEGLQLTEIAPGIDVRRDVLGMMDFEASVAPELKRMDARLFRPEPMGLEM